MDDNSKRLLIFGAGVIGSIFAARLSDAGFNVTVIARGGRLTEIRHHGIILEEALSQKRLSAKVKVIETLEPDDKYDLVIVTIRRNQLMEALPILAQNLSENILLAINNPAGIVEIAKTLEHKRIFLGFPGVGGGRGDGIIRYVQAPFFIQPTTFGALNPKDIFYIKAFIRMFKKAGFPTTQTSNIDAWQKSHVAWVIPIANALYMVDGDHLEMAKRPDVLRLMLLAIRESFQVLRAMGVSITPLRLRVLELVPVGILVKIMSRVAGTSFFENIAAKHANSARDEMKFLADEFMQLVQKSSLSTPALDELYR